MKMILYGKIGVKTVAQNGETIGSNGETLAQMEKHWLKWRNIDLNGEILT